MMVKSRWNKSRKRLAAALLIAIAAMIWGLMLLQLNIGQGLRRASYDLPFLFTEFPPPQDIVLVYMDEASHVDLDQSFSEAWDRRLHARLVEKLTEQGARMIVFDILFHDEKPEQDESFAAAIQKHGNVVLAGELVRKKSADVSQQALLLATPTLRRAAAGWGLTDIPIDPDGFVRQIRHQIPTDFGDKPSLAEFIRKKEQGTERESPETLELINYYGPAGTFTSFSYAAVIMNRGIPENAFRDKIVIIGARQKAGLADAGKDTFATPYALHTMEQTPGKEIHATVIGNLLQGRGLARLMPSQEVTVILLASCAFAAAACLLSPTRGVPLCIALGGVFTACGFLLRESQGLQFLWTIPAFGQMPFVTALSLVAHYRIEYSARWKLRAAFKSYMSDEQARQIDEEEVSLELGGKEVEATIFFSDLAGFTPMSEGLPPQSVSKALISYFERATEGILDNGGTIIKYVGDAVMATWGAPLKVDREADSAIDAAIQMQMASSVPIVLETPAGMIEQILETRIGINSGLGLAGNLGSSRRFDYSVIGDTTNTAARLEGLNKMLGTSILVSESVIHKCQEPERFLKRRMGKYVLKGRKGAVEVYEIMGYAGDASSAVRKRSSTYLQLFESGLDAFERGDFPAAERFLSECSPLHDRQKEDPAARLMLKAIHEVENAPLDWQGHITLDSK